jgi:diguanylate cyclase (GGDEF)-like protein
MAYPLGDVLVFGVLARVLTTAGARTAAFRLLLGAGACLLAADVGFGLSTLEGSFFTSWVNMLYLASYVLWGAGALHPSMRATSEPAPEAAATFTRGRLTLLTVASLVAPGTLAAQSLLDLPLDVWAVVVSSVVLFLLVILRMSGLLRQVQEQAGQLADLARTDSLTGLPNRRTADAELERMVRLAAADGSPVTAAILDLDRFKAFNDTFGHQAGDRLLTESAAAWKGQLAGRQCVLARYGGEEFLVLSLGQDLGPFVEMLHRMRVATPAGQTFSAGAARWDGTETAAALLGRADVALYAAKRSGRDRVHTAQAAGVAAAR